MPQQGALVARGERWEAELLPVVPDLVKYRYRERGLFTPEHPGGGWKEGHARTIELAQATVMSLLAQDELTGSDELITWTPHPETPA